MAGFLSDKYSLGSFANKTNEGSRLNTVDSFIKPEERHFRIVDVQKEVAVAGEPGAGAAQIALAWLLKMPNTIPIVGALNLRQFEDSLKAVALQL